MSTKFINNIDLCRQYINDDGRLSFPRKDPKARRLGNWIRHQFKRENVSELEMSLLNTLRPHMNQKGKQDENEEKWRLIFEQYRVYRNEYHTLMISTKDEKHKSLRDWTFRQRRLEKLGRLSPERKEALYCFFQFGTKEKRTLDRFTLKQKETWNERFRELVDYKNEFGHCNVATDDTNHPQLARWIYSQRDTFATGRMDSEREDKLNSIGFNWKI